jgi:uncharacterized membrane protein
MSNANTLTLIDDPAWPWSLPLFGLPALVVVAVVLVALTVWTYVGVRGATWRRILAVLALRLLALLLAFTAVVRPSFVSRDELKVPSWLIFALDSSQSMTIQDEVDGQSRWAYLLRVLRENQGLLDRLRDEHNVNVALYRFDAEVGEYVPETKPDGKRTDFGEMLNNLYERYRGERFLRGLVIFSDGADNGSRYQPLALAQQWRNLPCPVHTVGVGKPTTSDKQSDIAVVAINPEPAPVPVKAELVVKGVIDAPGFENAKVRIKLLFDDQQVAVQEEELKQAVGNEVKIKATAPSKPGEIKVTLRVDKLPGEVTEANNEISTYVTVTKEGISVLLVDKERFPEPQLLADALRVDKRISLFTIFFRGAQGLNPGKLDLFQFDKQHYDVIILGDVTPARLQSGNANALKIIHDLVSQKGTGLMMMGGYDSFGPNWRGTEIEKVLPVRLPVPAGQVEAESQMLPDALNYNEYIMRLEDQPGMRLDDAEARWRRLRPLNGRTKLGEPKPGAKILARARDAQDGDPLLVTGVYGDGRTLAFGGDTTYRWISDPAGQKDHGRFWRQLVVWLAKQDEAEGDVWVKPDTRRLAAGSKLGLSMGLRKGGVELPGGQFEVKVISPEKVETAVPAARDRDENRATFWKTDAPGEYRVVVSGKGKDAAGQQVSGQATARFLVYQDDAEMLRRAADHDFLKRLAATGGGEFRRPDALGDFLRKLAAQPLAQGRPKAKTWPNWNATSKDPDFTAAQTASFVLWLLFTALLALEWFLRRRWGLV